MTSDEGFGAVQFTNKRWNELHYCVTTNQDDFRLAASKLNFGRASATYQMKQLRCDSIRWVRVSPLKGSGSLIVGFNVAHELAAQVGNGFEDSAGNNVALDFGEPVFDLVEPGTRRA
jgi:hypothetical protein